MKHKRTVVLLIVTMFTFFVIAQPAFALKITGSTPEYIRIEESHFIDKNRIIIQHNQIEPMPSLDHIDLDESQFTAENKKIEEQGRMVLDNIEELGTRGSRYLNVPYYNQCDSTWGSDIMQTCGRTICGAGCALTSFSMIQRYLGGAHNPHWVNITLGNNACPFQYYAAASAYGFSVYSFNSNTQTNSYVINYCIGNISNNRPVMIGMINSGGGTHFVVAYGYNNSTIYIKDPAGTFSSLQSYFNNGWRVNRLCVYRN